MAIPSVNSLSNLPGGALPNILDAYNTFGNNRAMRNINEVKSQYAPLTTQAEAASKLAYANLMGPQFLAKIMGNDSALANMTEDQKKAALQKIYQAASGQGSGINAFNQMPNHTGIGQPSTNNFAGNIKNAFLSLIGKNPAAANNALAQGTPQQPAQMPTNQQRPKGAVAIEGQQWYDKDGNPVYAEEEVKVPGKPTIDMTLTEGQRPKTYGEKAGEYKGLLEEGKETGKIRATARKELDQEYQQALQLKAPFEKLNQIISNPIFQNLRNLPALQKLQMKGKANFGNAAEQKLVGEFQAAARNVVAATVKGFGGRILASEIPLSESMKLGDDDTIGVMLGKAPVIEAFNEFTLQRARIASKLMKQYHMDKGDALEQADKMVDGDAIRAEIDNQINPVTEEDIDFTAKQLGIPKEQVIQRLRQQGRYNG